MITPQELEDNDGMFVGIIDYTGQVYEGILHYEPVTNSQYPIQIWMNDCCFITFLQLDDAASLVPVTPCISQPCCIQCLPGLMLMSLNSDNIFCTCLTSTSYALEWNTANQKYEFDYPAICGCGSFHVELYCSGTQWVCYFALKDGGGVVCVSGIDLNFPIDCATMTGMANIAFTLTGNCMCGPCLNDTFTVTLSPL